MEEICRVCLGHCDDMVNIFAGTLGSGPSIPDMIAEWSGYQVEKGDSLPENICLSCLEDAQNAFEIQQTSELGHQFLCQVKEVECIGNDLRKEEYFTISDSESEASRSGHPVKDIPFGEKESNKENNAQQFDSETMELNSLEDEMSLGQTDQSMCQFTEDSNSGISAGELDQSNGYAQGKDEVCEISDDETKSSDCQIQEDAKSEKSVGKDDQPHFKIGNDDVDLGSPKISDNEERPHKCPVCAKTFARHCSFQNHLRGHAEDADSASNHSTDTPSDKSRRPRKTEQPQGLIKNDTSSQSDDLSYRPNQSGPEAYRRVRTDERPYKCNLCQKSFVRKAGVIVHLRVHTGERPYQCDLCPKAFKQHVDLSRHMLTHTKERPHKCNLCDMSFTHPSALKVHFRDHRGERPFKCDRCPKTFRLNFCLKEHMRKHTGERPYKCDKCPKALKAALDLKRHMLTHAKKFQFKRIKSLNPQKKQMFQCAQCPKIFRNKSMLRVHLRVHTGERPFECDKCASSFKHNIDLKRHILTHQTKGPYKCQQCDMSFARPWCLNVHMEDHAREKPVHSTANPYKCDQCERSFNKQSSLKRHTTMCHKPIFKCLYCTIVFREKKKLEEHVKTHTCEKPYSCGQCPRTFKFKPSLRAHKRIHIGEKPHKCPYCQKSFAYQASLTSHMQSHSKLRSYKCTQCLSSFSHLPALEKHIKTHKNK
ncbi:zinc finger protein 271-like [Drosophila subpulchrella]|uniref:zinc finger protein 271-like n=1 Tax=Drosophila subpulchrella TaxID=1486046 RepID=UPI0018A17A7B|nr:zinc finger protein 271-like [Drosophila subpulchrella]